MVFYYFGLEMMHNYRQTLGLNFGSVNGRFCRPKKKHLSFFFASPWCFLSTMCLYSVIFLIWCLNFAFVNWNLSHPELHGNQKKSLTYKFFSLYTLPPNIQTNVTNPIQNNNFLFFIINNKNSLKPKNIYDNCMKTRQYKNE